MHLILCLPYGLRSRDRARLAACAKLIYFTTHTGTILQAARFCWHNFSAWVATRSGDQNWRNDSRLLAHTYLFFAFQNSRGFFARGFRNSREFFEKSRAKKIRAGPQKIFRVMQRQDALQKYTRGAQKSPCVMQRQGALQKCT